MTRSGPGETASASAGPCMPTDAGPRKPAEPARAPRRMVLGDLFDRGREPRQALRPVRRARAGLAKQLTCGAGEIANSRCSRLPARRPRPRTVDDAAAESRRAGAARVQEEVLAIHAASCSGVAVLTNR